MALSNEALLAQALKSGSKSKIASAFEKIYLDYSKLVSFNIAKYIGDHETIKDLTHNAFLKFFNNAENVTGEIKSYLCAIARNITINYLNECKRFEPLDNPEQVVDDASPNSALFYSDLINDLNRVLTPREVEIILLHVDGYSFKEIGEKLGITANNANIIYFRGIKKYKLDQKTGG